VHVLSVSALKGGVGKTTITLGLASAALSLGIKTLVVDLDPQGNASSGLGLIGDFNPSAAEAVAKPKYNTIMQSILASTWAKGQTGLLDVLVSQNRIAKLNVPNPSFRALWKLDELLSKVQNEYQLVIIDTPPNLNALTRMAWVASDRVMLVSEPSINSVLGIANAVKAFNEMKRQVNRQVRLFGIVINRLRPTLAEHQYRVNELEQIYPELVSEITFEEKSPLNQSQGAGRSIHSWPGQAAAKLASNFDDLLTAVMDSFYTEETLRTEQVRTPKDTSRRALRNRETTKPSKPSGRRAATKTETPKAERIEQVDTLPVSPEYQDKFQEVLRQAMTEKQIKALREIPKEED